MIVEKSDLYVVIYYDYFLIDKIIKPDANMLDDGDDDDNTGNPLRKLMRGRIESNDYDFKDLFIRKAEIRCRVSLVRFEANKHQEDVKCKL